MTRRDHPLKAIFDPPIRYGSKSVTAQIGEGGGGGPVTPPTLSMAVADSITDGTNLDNPRCVAIKTVGSSVYALISSSTAGTAYLTSIDITDPTNISIVDTIFNSALFMKGSMVLGDVLFGVMDSRAVSVDVTDPTNLGSVLQNKTLTVTASPVLRSICALDDTTIAVWNEDNSSMTTLDVSDPTNMAVLGSSSALGSSTSAWFMVPYTDDYVFKDWVLLSDNSNDALRAYDVTTRASPTLARSLSNGTTLNGASGIAVHSALKVVAMGSNLNDRITTLGIAYINSSLFSLDSETNSTTLNNPEDVKVWYDYAVMVGVGPVGTEGVTAANIADPGNIVGITQLTDALLTGLSVNPGRTALHGNTLVVLSSSNDRVIAVTLA